MMRVFNLGSRAISQVDRGKTMTASTRVFEGTADEIAEQLRLSHLDGKLKALVTSDELLIGEGQGSVLSEELADYLSELDKMEFQPGTPLAKSENMEISRLVAAKLAKLGHTK